MANPIARPLTYKLEIDDQVEAILFILCAKDYSSNPDFRSDDPRTRNAVDMFIQWMHTFYPSLSREVTLDLVKYTPSWYCYIYCRIYVRAQHK